jgi:hypothetical protein
MDFLARRLFPSHQRLNRRSRRRFRAKLTALDHALRDGRLDERQAQDRALALLAFTRTPGMKSWRFRSRTLDLLSGEGPALGAGLPRRQLEQHGQELPLRLP